MLTLLVVGLFLLSALLEFARSQVLIRVGNRFDMLLNQRIFTASFERNLRRAGGNPAQAVQDLTNVRQFLTGNALIAFFDAPWTDRKSDVLGKSVSGRVDFGGRRLIKK